MQDLSKYVDMGAFKKNSYIFKRDLPIKLNIPTEILNDIELFREIDKEVLESQDNFESVRGLEQFRNFSYGFLVEKGVIYTGERTVLERFPLMKLTTLAQADNDILSNRYLLPIKLINGLTFTYMGYSTGTINRYVMPKVINSPTQSYAHQGNLLGNLESIAKYNGEIYFAEGFFDAYRIEEQFEKAGVAILGSKISRTKYRLLKEVKRRLGRKFIYIPDIDENGAGTSRYLLELDIWDKIFNFNKEFNTSHTFKDIDQYFRNSGR